MHLDLTDEQKMLQNTVREFAAAEVKPHARELDETGHFPMETFRKAAELGLTGVAFPDDMGGAGFDHVAYTIVIEEISRCCASTGAILSVQNSLFCDPIHRFGTDEQKKKLWDANEEFWKRPILLHPEVCAKGLIDGMKKEEYLILVPADMAKRLVPQGMDIVLRNSWAEDPSSHS